VIRIDALWLAVGTYSPGARRHDETRRGGKLASCSIERLMAGARCRAAVLSR